MRQPQLDREGVEFVRLCVDRQRGKPYGELVAFNEGVIAASNALGAFIDGAKDAPPQAIHILEAAFQSMTRVRVPSKMFPAKPSGEV